MSNSCPSVQISLLIWTDRDVQADSTDTIEKAVQTIRDHGFINYYGMQRFGSSRTPTHVIGLLILLGEWELACDTLLAEKEGENWDAKEARRLWREDKNAAAALRKLPRGNVAERCSELPRF